MEEVYALVEGATLLGGAKGLWRGQVETTNLVRIIVRRSDIRIDDFLSTVRAGVETLMDAWLASNCPQDSVMFTIRELTVHNARRTLAVAPNVVPPG